LGVQELRPVRVERQRTPHYVVTAAVIRKDGTVLIAKRPEGGLLGALWEFPGGKLQPGEDLASCLQREIQEELGVSVHVGGSIGVYRHAYTHFSVTLHAFACRLADSALPQPHEHEEIRWVSLAELPGYPMGKIDRKIAKLIMDG
jgi:A/G-specific adenine glycosylase